MFTRQRGKPPHLWQHIGPGPSYHPGTMSQRSRALPVPGTDESWQYKLLASSPPRAHRSRGGDRKQGEVLANFLVPPSSPQPRRPPPSIDLHLHRRHAPAGLLQRRRVRRSASSCTPPNALPGSSNARPLHGEHSFLFFSFVCQDRKSVV